jgi:bifunctional DNase/RNase
LMEKPVSIHGLAMDPKNNSPILLLKDDGVQRALPVWIGMYEANAIATCLSGLESPRPMTHDLLYNMITQAGYKVSRVVITELKDTTFYAVVYLSSNSGDIELDSRPSDAVALAVRSEAPIFVMEDILDRSAVDMSTIEEDTATSQKDKWLEMLENMDPEDYSKYKM